MNSKTYAKLVALHAEGVDRNPIVAAHLKAEEESPSMRRAWIEIFGSVLKADLVVSPSMRRAWIEIALNSSSDVPAQSPSMRRAWIEMILRILF